MVLCTLFLLAASTSDWPVVGMDAGGTRCSTLASITKENVDRLRRAWTHRTGHFTPAVKGMSFQFECTPILSGGLLYGVTPFSEVFALDPDSGKAIWSYDPKIGRTGPEAIDSFTCRGVSAWRDSRTGRTRIFVATHDARLIALDARSGRIASEFGRRGTVDLRDGVGLKHLHWYSETSAPCVVGDLVVVGSAIGDNRAVEMPSGVVRAYNARSGRLKWSWEPMANERKPDGSPDLKPRAEPRTGAGNAWITLSADPARGLVFVPTGSPSPDFYGGTRVGDDRDANSIVALRVRTGKEVWAFQLVHHDLWDYDIAAQPIVSTVAGRPAVIVMTKMGFVFVFDELTGKPLLPVEERPVPQYFVSGERGSLTEPFPILPPPLSSPPLKAWGLTPKAEQAAETKIEKYHYDGIFTPPCIRGSIDYPGSIGGCNWSGGSYDPQTNTLYTNTNSLADAITLVPHQVQKNGVRLQSGVGEMEGTPFSVRTDWLFAPDRIPQTSPPWGQLYAIDLATGTIRWAKPLGYLPELEPIPQAKEWGSPNLGGPAMTHNGLVFIGASRDPHLRAFDASTGAVLWEAELPAGGQATPMIYRSAKTGIEYLVICAGGHTGLGTKLGDYVVAYRVP